MVGSWREKSGSNGVFPHSQEVETGEVMFHEEICHSVTQKVT